MVRVPSTSPDNRPEPPVTITARQTRIAAAPDDGLGATGHTASIAPPQKPASPAHIATKPPIPLSWRKVCWQLVKHHPVRTAAVVAGLGLSVGACFFAPPAAVALLFVAWAAFSIWQTRAAAQLIRASAAAAAPDDLRAEALPSPPARPLPDLLQQAGGQISPAVNGALQSRAGLSSAAAKQGQPSELQKLTPPTLSSRALASDGRSKQLVVSRPPQVDGDTPVPPTFVENHFAYPDPGSYSHDDYRRAYAAMVGKAGTYCGDAEAMAVGLEHQVAICIWQHAGEGYVCEGLQGDVHQPGAPVVHVLKDHGAHWLGLEVPAGVATHIGSQLAKGAARQLPTVADGDCFFDAVALGLRAMGRLTPTRASLRADAARVIGDNTHATTFDFTPRIFTDGMAALDQFERSSSDAARRQLSEARYAWSASSHSQSSSSDGLLSRSDSEPEVSSSSAAAGSRQSQQA